MNGRKVVGLEGTGAGAGFWDAAETHLSFSLFETVRRCISYYGYGKNMLVLIERASM
jgi:hypothetical protein